VGNRLRATTVAALALTIGMCAAAQAQSLGVLPATFKGDLPCADCSAIQYRLDLFADHTYDLLMIHRGKPGAGTSQSGRWQIVTVGNMTLLGERGATTQFAIESADSLRLLSQDGAPIQSSLNYTLRRDTQTPDAELTNTPWHLTRLEGQSARRFENQRDAQIVLRSDGAINGSDGCNRLTGSYRLTASSLSFSQLASTRMTCLNGMEQAARFTGALGAVARYSMAGRHLELFDAADTLLMRFEAVYTQ
jgi:copper homeostasis protein (lipoprotein)